MRGVAGSFDKIRTDRGNRKKGKRAASCATGNGSLLMYKEMQEIF